MQIALHLIPAILPLYFLIIAGFFAARKMQIDVQSIANVTVTIFAPIVVFGAFAQMSLKAEFILLPFLMGSLSLVMTLFAFCLGQRLFGDDRASIMAMGASSGNTGYFGIPIILLLLGSDALGFYFLANIGSEIVSLTVGYYFLARGRFHALGALKVVAKLPVLYAVALGLLWNFLSLPLPEIFITYWEYFTGAWIILGMMLVGLGLAKMDFALFRPLALFLLLLIRHFAWPMAMILIILADRAYLNLFSTDVHTALLVFGTVPLAGLFATLAAKLSVRPAEAALAVLTSTCLALLTVPFYFWLITVL